MNIHFDKDWPVQYITHYNTLPSALHHLKEPTMKQEKAIFACGCFWGAQHQFERAHGVLRSTVGYIGGHKDHPTYPEVKSHTTGHAEATLVELTQKKPLSQNCASFSSKSMTRHRPTVKARTSVRSTAVKSSTWTKTRNRRHRP